MAKRSSTGLRTLQTPRLPGRPLDENQLQKLLTNPYYTGVVRFQGATYPGRHQPLIDSETFDHVQAVLHSRRYGERKKVNDHYLKSSLFCGHCAARMFVQITRSRSGDTYPYFVCGGRHNKTTTCQLGAVLIADIEEKVAQLYDTLRRDMTPQVRQRIETDLAAEHAYRSKDSTQALHDLDTERQKLEREQERLLQAHYADAIPLDLMKKEQDRIRTALHTIQTESRTLAQDLTAAEQFFSLALDLVQDCAKTYRDAPAPFKKLFNQVFFDRIDVIDKDIHAVMNEPFGSLIQRATATTLDTEDIENGDSDGVAVHTAELAGVQASQPTNPVFSATFTRKTTLVRPKGFEPPTF